MSLLRTLVATATLVTLPLTASAMESAQNACAGSGTIVYFGNGVNNTRTQTMISSEALKNAVINLKGAEDILEFRRAYNPSDGLPLDVLEVMRQKNAENSEFSWHLMTNVLFYMIRGAAFPAEIQARLEGEESFLSQVQTKVNEWISEESGQSQAYYDSTASEHVEKYKVDMRAGRRVIVVSHSQGNLYSLAAYDKLSSDNQPMEAFGILAVATPAARNVGDYITSTNDRIINALRAFDTNVLAGNVELPVPDDDSTGHGFTEVYLSASYAGRSIVQNMFKSLLDNLLHPPSDLGAGPLVATLTWDRPGDIDLHIFEPEGGSHVYYSRKQGAYGFLDRDDTSGTGPEHYYTACDTFKEGVYTFGLNYYYGEGSYNATVDIQALGNSPPARTVTLTEAEGSDGNDNPSTVFTVKIGKRENGRFFVESIQ